MVNIQLDAGGDVGIFTYPPEPPLSGLGVFGFLQMMQPAFVDHLLEPPGCPGNFVPLTGGQIEPVGSQCDRDEDVVQISVIVQRTKSAVERAFDQLALLFVGLLRDAIPAPVPILGTMPTDAPGILLFSGDEDNAPVEFTNSELDHLASLGARMNLYIIPTSTHATPADVERFSRHHDVGPHPNIRPLDGRPVAERVAEFARQIRMFEDMFGIVPRSYRNHCHAWAGYLEPVDALEELGVRMDANYMCSNYARGRIRSPYLGFGAAMPMRYCTPDGRIIDVVQQHTHLADDTMFSSEAVYSYKYSPRQFEVLLRRTLGDIARRFHTPYGVNIHPGNWARFSRPQGEILLRQAEEWDMPVWSWDQWSRFWDTRDTWRLDRLEWDGRELTFTAEGAESDPDLRLWLPLRYGDARLAQVTVNGDVIPWQEVSRHGQPVGLVPLTRDGATSHFTVTYT